MTTPTNPWDTIIVGGGLAGWSAAIYLARALRRVLVIDSGHSLAAWEPEVQNYLGFPDGIHGEELLRRGRDQATRYGAQFLEGLVEKIERHDGIFTVAAAGHEHPSRRVLLATGLFHLPPDLPERDACLGQSMFFCKDCDGFRVQGKAVAILGRNNEAVEYALGILSFTPRVYIMLHGQAPAWDRRHDEWVSEYELPVLRERIVSVEHRRGLLHHLVLEQDRRLELDALFTTRGDVYHNQLACGLGAQIDPEGQVVVNEFMETTVPGLFAAGCVTPANCQMIIAAGQGATAAQAINRSLFEESLRNHALRRLRENQCETESTDPVLRPV